MPSSAHSFASRGTVELLDDDVDDLADVSSMISSSRGHGRAPTRHNSDYRRPNRYAEDGYGDSDFA